MSEEAIEYILCDVHAVRRACGDQKWFDSVLSPDEVAQSNRFRHAFDRAGYRCAHLIFRLMAARRLGFELSDAGELRFTRRCRSCGGPHGKPQIAGAEISLSRSGTMLLVASAPPSSPIGVDVEGVPSDVFPGFDDYVLAPGECSPRCTDPVRRRLELWAAKEAALKTTGHGLSVEPHELEVLRNGDEASAVDVGGDWTSSVRAPEHAELNGLSLASVPCRPSHAAALSCADRLPVTSLTLSDLLTG